MRYPVSGANAVAITPASASSRVAIYSITSGKVFWLRGLSLSVNATTGPLIIMDATVGGTATTPKVTIPLAVGSVSEGPAAYVVRYSPPGIKFSTNCVAMMAASGSIPIGDITVWGYEE